MGQFSRTAFILIKGIFCLMLRSPHLLVFLGSNLKKLRIQRGYSMQRLADAAGISKESVRRIENGISDPRILTLSRMSHALGVDLCEVINPGESYAHPHKRS